ncbi:MAG: hypothetical protein AAGJ18_24230, partial [Bacteroidota bacterium]
MTNSKAYADSLFQLIPTATPTKKIALYFEALKGKNTIGPLRITIGKAAITHAAAIQHEELAAFASLQISTPLINSKQYTEAAKCLNTATDYYTKQSDKKLYVTCLILQGYYHHRQQFTTEALRYYLEALPLAEEIGNIKRINNLYNRITNLYIANQEYRKAFRYAALINANCQPTPNDCPFYSNYLDNVSRIYLALGKVDSARHFIKRYHTLSNRTKPEYRQIAYEQLADLSTLEGNWQRAIIYGDSALQIAQATNRTMAMVTIHHNQAARHQKIGNSQKQLFHLEKQYKIAQKAGFLGHQQAALSGLWNYYEQVNQLETALNYADQWRIISDSLRGVERQNSVKRQDELLAERVKEQKLQTLEKAQAKQRSRNNLLLASTLFLLATLGLTIYFLRQRRR